MERGIFKNTEVLKKHGILMKTPSFDKKDGFLKDRVFDEKDGLEDFICPNNLSLDNLSLND